MHAGTPITVLHYVFRHVTCKAGSSRHVTCKAGSSRYSAVYIQTRFLGVADTTKSQKFRPEAHVTLVDLAIHVIKYNTWHYIRFPRTM